MENSIDLISLYIAPNFIINCKNQDPLSRLHFHHTEFIDTKSLKTFLSKFMLKDIN